MKQKKSLDESHTNIKKSQRDSSLQEIGDALGLTRMRICQIEKKILEKIKDSGILHDFMP